MNRALLTTAAIVGVLGIGGAGVALGGAEQEPRPAPAAVGWDDDGPWDDDRWERDGRDDWDDGPGDDDADDRGELPAGTPGAAPLPQVGDDHLDDRFDDDRFDDRDDHLDDHFDDDRFDDRDDHLDDDRDDRDDDRDDHRDDHLDDGPHED